MSKTLPLTLALLACCLPAVAISAAPTKTSAVKGDSGWVFSLLPKSLQKNPRLDITVITEMTEAGKKLPPVSPAKPAYFDLFSSGYHALGERTANERTVPEQELQGILTKSLAANGYLLAKPPEHAPSLVVLYTWGTHNLLVEGDADNPALSPEAVERNMLDRAALVGGKKFAEELKGLFERTNDLATASHTPPSDPTGLVPDVQPVIAPEQMAFMNPVNIFKHQSIKNEILVDQAASNVYYVVASAYDYESMKAKKPVLLWRTRMTVASDGVSQTQSLPTLVLAAAPYFGKDMPEPEIISKRTVPDGTVEVGTPTVVESANQTTHEPKRQ